MDKQKVLEKIKKCLALGESANEHEAAQAIRQAQILMKKYGISDADIEMADIKEHICHEKTAMKMSQWQAQLAHTVKTAFGCEWYLGGSWNNAKVVFYGVGNKAELASYAYSVLLRQLKQARREYMATVLKRVRLAKNKTYRADEFCKGWITAVYHKVDKFANGEREQALLQLFGEQMNLSTTKTRTVAASANAKKQGMFDQFLGRQQGKKAQLHQAMGGDERKQLEAT